ncbi:MAG: FAD-dependent oxidoreductase [Bacteroidetes bacterium]|nr:FAD-dependent oxidoreductase [Bacteroidota bacterium]HET6244345.1 FAD-dependent oxidoreductase [Bacteroidia bacterium]
MTIINNNENNFDLSDASGDITSGQNNTFWINSSVPVSYSELQQDISVDVVIVGGGIAGVTTAYMLVKEGKTVAIIEDGYIGSGETGRTTAHIVNALDDRYFEIEKVFGHEGARLAAQSHTAAIEMIEKIVLEEAIPCDFERLNGYLFLHSSDKEESIIEEYEATQRAGINTEIINHIPGIPTEQGPCLKFKDQAQFHPMKYLKGLCDVIISFGGMIFTGTHAKTIDKNGIVTSHGYRVKAKQIVVATNSPVNNKVAIHTKQAPYRTYVIGAKIPKNSLPKALWWDTGEQNSKWHTNPYHYVRLQSYDHKYDLLIIGGEDHKTGQDEEQVIDRFQRLKKWALKRFPIEEIIYKWSGQVIEPVDYLAFIGRNPMDSKNIYIVTGDSGNGMTHGTIAGILITDLIHGRKNDWAKIYDPSRIHLESTKEFIEENANVIKQYGDFLKGDKVENEDFLMKGEGAIIRNGMSRLAVYKDEFGEIHAYNAICPHLKCVVHWNNDEKTFDCPCHGSRFSCYGKVVNGPANSDLSLEKIPESFMVYEKIHAQIRKEK